MCQQLPVPVLHQILHITIVMRVCIFLEQNDTMLQQKVKSQLHLILQESAVISAINLGTNWHKVVKQKFILAEEHEVHDFQSTMTAPCSFILR
jgi:hypothetical protein